MNKFSQPNQDNVRTGDFLIDNLNGNLCFIPIKEIKKDGIYTEEYKIPGNGSITTYCPYKGAIIQK